MSNENKATEKRFGVKIVTAWFESVINPALQGLAMEQEQLEKKSLTWQFLPGGFELIRLVKQMIPIGYAPNLEQFETYHPVISENIKAHDNEVAQLFVVCMNLQREILDSGELEKIFARVTTEENLNKLGKSLNDMFTGGYKPEYLGWIAQEMINRTGELPSYIKHSPLWNMHRDEFMQVLNHEQVSGAKVSTDRAGEKLLGTVNHLIRLLKETREQLSLEYDVPLVPTVSIIAA
jgi:hypothetical protein